MFTALVITICAALGLVVYACFCGLGKRSGQSSGAAQWFSSTLALAASVAGLSLALVAVTTLGGGLVWAMLVGSVLLTLGSVFLLGAAYVATSFPRDLSGH